MTGCCCNRIWTLVMPQAKFAVTQPAFSCFDGIKNLGGRQRAMIKTAGIFFGLLICVGIHIAVLVASGNFHAVVEGEAYRAAQPSPARLKQMVADYGIKSVINLRGRKADKEWYRQEIATAAALSVAHIDFRMSSSRQLSQDETKELVRIMRDAPKPVLIHCDHGINRAGLASALYLAAVKKDSEFKSELQLSPIYGYWPLFFLPTYAMYGSWQEAETGLGF